MERISNFFNKKYAPSLFFLSVSFLLLVRIIFSDGAIMGGDWSLPVTSIQIDEYFKHWNSSWTDQGNMFGSRQLALTSLPLVFIMKLSNMLGIGGYAFSKLLLLSLFSFAGYSMYRALRFFNMGVFAALSGGVLYITAPIVFNYAIMGWQFVLFVMVLIPQAVVFFTRAVEERKYSFAIMTGFIYAISMIQSQSIFWFPIIFACLGFYLIRDKASLVAYAKNLFIVLVLFFLLNSYWILGMIVSPSNAVTGSSIVNSEISLGTLARFKPENMIRLFGSLYNSQFESVSNASILLPLSFILPILAVGSLLVGKRKRLIVAMWLLGLIPFAMYVLNFNRDILLYIPFSNVIRDFSRFIVLSTFAYIFLIAVFLDHLFMRTSKERKFAWFLILVCLLSVFPWWTGELTNWMGKGADMRLRTKVFPGDYLSVEKNLSLRRADQKALFLPIGGTVDFAYDPKFHGSFQEIQDVFACYSPIPGMLAFSDRGLGSADSYVANMKNNQLSMNELLMPTNVRYIVFRRDMFMKGGDEVYNGLEKMSDEGKLSEYSVSDNVAVFLRNDFVPHFYVPGSLVVSQRDVSILQKIFTSENLKSRPVVFFREQNESKNETLETIKNSQEGVAPSALEFKKINLTKYRVRVHAAKGSFPLVFSESFHDGWKAYLEKNQSQESGTRSADNYKMLDGNDGDQATMDELKEYIQKGWVTGLKSGNDIDFVSKNFNGTIQNDNLPDGKFWETWSQKPVDENNHLMANGYANSWIIDADKLCAGSDDCVKNPDGSYDFEVVVEFWPQKLFYIGLFISGLTLFGCLICLVRVRRKSGIKEAEIENEPTVEKETKKYKRVRRAYKNKRIE